MSRSLRARVRGRLANEARSLAPLVDSAKALPLAQSARRTLTSVRFGLKAKLGDPDRLLDHIVDRALTDARADEQRTRR